MGILVNHKIILDTKHPRNLGHYKRPNLRTIGMKEGNEFLLKNPENMFNKITEEKSPPYLYF